MNYVLIGDIHSQSHRLNDALRFIRSNIENACVVFLGDIFDTRCGYSNSAEVYSLIRESEQDLNSIVIQSNHQDKLIRYLKGNKVSLNNGLQETVDDFQLAGVSLDELYNWLLRQSFGVVFRDNQGLEFRCAHAYFSNEIQVQDYQNHYLVKTVDRKLKYQFLYGILDDEKNRIEWWNQDNTAQNFVRVSGHYHTVYTDISNMSLVLDSGCGHSDEKLSIYDVNSRALFEF